MAFAGGYLTLGTWHGARVRAHWTVAVGAAVFGRALLVLIHEARELSRLDASDRASGAGVPSESVEEALRPIGRLGSGEEGRNQSV